MQEIKTYFGKNLKRIRKSKGFTQENLAERIGVERRQITRIETGKSYPSFNSLDNLCEVLETAPNELFDFSSFINKDRRSDFDESDKIINDIKTAAEKYKNSLPKLNFILLAAECFNDKKSVLKMQNMLDGMLLV